LKTFWTQICIAHHVHVAIRSSNCITLFGFQEAWECQTNLSLEYKLTKYYSSPFTCFFFFLFFFLCNMADARYLITQKSMRIWCQLPMSTFISIFKHVYRMKFKVQYCYKHSWYLLGCINSWIFQITNVQPYVQCVISKDHQKFEKVNGLSWRFHIVHNVNSHATMWMPWWKCENWIVLISWSSKKARLFHNPIELLFIDFTITYWKMNNFSKN